MKPRLRKHAIRIPLAAACALSFAHAATAAFGSDYDSAVVQVERGRFAQALPLLDAVIGDVPASQKRVRLYGVRFAPYTPYFYRGLAHYRLGRCEEALRDFAREARFDVLAENKHETMSAAVADCRTKLAAAGTPVPADAPAEPAGGTAADALRALVAAYFNGDYALVAAYDPAVLASPAEQAQAWLYRAAAQYTLAVLSGDDGTAALVDVQASLAKAHKNGALPAVDLTQFPPKFVKLFPAAAHP
jgi:hypothetical protein